MKGFPVPPIPLGGDTASALIHIYPHKPLRKNEVVICNHQVDSPFFICGLMSDRIILQAQKKSIIIHDTVCRY